MFSGTGGEHESKCVDKQCGLCGTLGGWATRTMLRMRERTTATFRCQAMFCKTMSVSRVNPTHWRPSSFSPFVNIHTQICSDNPAVRQCDQMEDTGTGPNVAAAWRCNDPRFPSNVATAWRRNHKCQDNVLKDCLHHVAESTERLHCDDP